MYHPSLIRPGGRWPAGATYDKTQGNQNGQGGGVYCRPIFL